MVFVHGTKLSATRGHLVSNMKQNEKLYVVSGSILPEALLKTAAAKELLHRKEAVDTSEAIQKLGISRSTFYKYRDGISTFFDLGTIRIANFSLLLEHSPGVLSGMLGILAQHKCNVLTINQGLPSQGTAVVTLSVGLDDATGPVDTVLAALAAQEGVADVRIDGISR